MHLDTFSDADHPNFQELVGVGDLVTFLDDEEPLRVRFFGTRTILVPL
jgi:hypothetical protein